MYTVFNTLSQLDSISTDQPTYIYGAKTIAIRVCMYLEKILNMGVKGFLVSSKYENPTEICQKTVYRIEDMNHENLGNVIIAVSWYFVEEITNTLSQYNIKNLYVISPLLFDCWPMDIIKTQGCKISLHTAISDSVQIFADDTSKIIIEAGVIIHDKVCMLAIRNSTIIIKANTQIKEKAFFNVEEGSSLTVGCYSDIAEKTSFTVKRNSVILLGGKSFLSEKTSLFAQNSSRIRIGTHSHIAEKTILRADNKSSIHTNRSLSLKEGSTISANDKSTIKLDHHITIDKNSNIYAGKFSIFIIGPKSYFGCDSNFSSSDFGRIYLGSSLRLDRNGSIFTSRGELFIGNKTTICSYFYINNSHTKIEIGEDNMFSLFVKMNTGSHEIFDQSTGRIIDNNTPIITGKHVWLGMGATLLPGCNIREGSIVGAAALVNKLVPPHSICAGVPAKVIRENIGWSRKKREN